MFLESYMLWGETIHQRNIGLTIVGYLYKRGIEKNDMGYACAVGMVLLVIALVINIVQLILTEHLRTRRNKQWQIKKKKYVLCLTLQDIKLALCLGTGFFLILCAIIVFPDIPNVNGMRTDVVDALKEMKIPVLRWQGGCFADEYHWMDGIGPKEKKKMINTHWGGVVEDNSFGTHEFFELCRQLGCKTYVNGNLGSGTVREMSEWVEYITFNGVSPMADLRKENGHEDPWTIDYFGVGNENWGCGGNMRPEHYADEYRRYQTYVRNYAGNQPINKICCGPNVDDYEWTKKVMATCFDHCDPKLHGLMDGLSLHYYTLPETEDDWNIKGSATKFTEDIFYQTLKRGYFMEELINRHGAIMDEYDPDKNIGLIVDEWGIWSDVEPGTNPGFLYQQNTMRDALVAGMTLNIFNKHSDRVKMACIAQLINVLQSVMLTDGDKSSRMVQMRVTNS